LGLFPGFHPAMLLRRFSRFVPPAPIYFVALKVLLLMLLPGAVLPAPVHADQNMRAFWEINAPFPRYQSDLSGAAPAYHPGFLGFADRIRVYAAFDLGPGAPPGRFAGDNNKPSVKDDAGRFELDRLDDASARLGIIVPVFQRFGMGFEAIARNRNTDIVIDINNDVTVPKTDFGGQSFLLSASGGWRVTETWSLGLSLGVRHAVMYNEIFYEIQDPATDFFPSLGVLWYLPDRMVTAGFRATADATRANRGVARRNKDFDGPEIILDDDDYDMELLLDTPPFSTEGLLRAGLLDSRLVLAFTGRIDWWYRDDYPAGIFSPDAFRVTRDFVVEYWVFQWSAFRVGLTRRDWFVGSGDLVIGLDDEAMFGRFGGLAGASLRLGSLVLDINAVYRTERYIMMPEAEWTEWRLIGAASYEF
jgi:hypothetical protein